MKHIGKLISLHETKVESSKLFEKKIDWDPAVRELREKFPGHKFQPGDLIQYTIEIKNCSDCFGLGSCKNMMPGYFMRPYNNQPQFAFVPCDKKTGDEKQREIERLIKSHCVPEHILKHTFSSLDIDGPRQESIKAALRFCTDFKRGETKNGLYLYGPMGVGKSAIAGAMTRELAKRGVDVLMVYFPDFLQEVKSAIKTNTVDDKLDAMREVSVLILDDIGAEPLTIWTRDEVLGLILQRRMERFPTIYTSNLTTKELYRHLLQTKDEKVPNEKKAARLMDRIEPFVEIREVSGRNRRRER